MGDVEAAIDGSLEGSEDTSSGGGAVQADVQEATEGSWTIIQRLHVVLVAVDLRLAGVQTVQTQLLQDAAGDQQTGAVGGGIVGQTGLDSELGQLVGVGGAHDLVALDAGVGDLAGDVLVAQTHNQTVLGRVVLVLVLERQAPAGIVVSASLTTPLELDLVPLEVLLVLHDLDEAHFGKLPFSARYKESGGMRIGGWTKYRCMGGKEKTWPHGRVRWFWVDNSGSEWRWWVLSRHTGEGDTGARVEDGSRHNNARIKG